MCGKAASFPTNKLVTSFPFERLPHNFDEEFVGEEVGRLKVLLQVLLKPGFILTSRSWDTGIHVTNTPHPPKGEKKKSAREVRLPLWNMPRGGVAWRAFSGSWFESDTL